MKTKNISKISNESVLKATGKDWRDWFSILDKKKMHLKTHKQIAEWIKENYGISGWWCQEVTVQYEREKGLRKLYEKPGGFEISVGKTLNAGVSVVYSHFNDGRLRKKWLDRKIKISTSTKSKSLRALWDDDTTRISVNFYPKSEVKTQVTVQHLKLPDSDSANEMKTYWTEQLTKLKSILEA